MPPRSPGSRWRTLLPAFALAGCSFRSPPEWPEVLAEVRARHPEVKQISVEALRLAPAPPLLLDARNAEEYARSHLQGARHAPDETAALAELGAGAPGRAIVVYCSVGVRSSALAEKLGARGFTDVANLEGGIFAWANAGLPTYRTDSAGEQREDRVHPYDARWGALLRPERRGE